MPLFGKFGERFLQLVRGDVPPAYAKIGAELVRLVDADGNDISFSGGSALPILTDLDTSSGAAIPSGYGTVILTGSFGGSVTMPAASDYANGDTLRLVTYVASAEFGLDEIFDVQTDADTDETHPATVVFVSDGTDWHMVERLKLTDM